MAVKLSNLKPDADFRGIVRCAWGSGIGLETWRTSGKGNKGQKSRKGYSRRQGFEGADAACAAGIPKRGFHNTTAWSMR